MISHDFGIAHSCALLLNPACLDMLQEFNNKPLKELKAKVFFVNNMSNMPNLVPKENL